MEDEQVGPLPEAVSRFRVLVAARSFGDPVREPWLKLERAGCELIPNDLGRSLREEELRARLGGVDALITGTDEVSERALQAADRLKVISKHGVGLDGIDLEAARARGIVVTATPGAADHSVADMALALLLAVMRRLVTACTQTREGRWPKLIGGELQGKRLGIVGLGRIGRQVARRAMGFGMEVQAYDPLPDPDWAQRHGVRYVSLEELLRTSDVVSLHAPLTAETRRLLDAERLALLRPGAVLINTARGELVDEEALLACLREGRISGAGLDVFAVEPLPAGHPLLGMEQVVVSPHMASYTREALARMGEMAAENVLRVLRGEEPLVRIV